MVKLMSLRKGSQADLKDDPVGIVAFPHFVEGARVQDAVQHEESIIEDDAAQAHDVVDVGAICDRAQHAQVHLQGPGCRLQ